MRAVNAGGGRREAGRGRTAIIAASAALAALAVGATAVDRPVDARDVAVGSHPASHLPLPVAPALTIARLQYDGGGDWYSNPSSLPNLLAAIAERTTLPVSRTEARVTLLDDRLWDYPFLHMTGHGTVRFTDAEVVRLREYLTRGGFLHADDNYGMDESFRREIARVFPDRPLVEVPLSHAVYHAVYDMPKGLPKVHEHDGKPPRGFGIFVGERLVVFYSHESDLGNGWEDPGTYDDPPESHEAALRMGINLFVYAVTSRAAL
jgi:hypothetical protein